MSAAFWLIGGVVYLTGVFHMHKGYQGNYKYIRLIYHKPSFGRYNDTTCADWRSLKEEVLDNGPPVEVERFMLR